MSAIIKKLILYPKNMFKILYRSTKEQFLREITDFRVGSWILVSEPKAQDMDKIKKLIPVNEDLLRDCLDPHEVPRIEKEEGITYVFTRMPYREGKSISTVPVMIAVGEDYVLTVFSKREEFLDKFFEQKIDFYTTQKAKLFFQLFFEINFLYSGFLANTRKEMQAFSVNFDRISNEDIMNFVLFENTLNEFLSSLIPTSATLDSLMSGRFFSLYERDRDLIEDLLLANRQLIELCKSNLKSIANIREAYSTIMTNKLNRIIKLLTSLTIVFTIPTMIASFFGMNVGLPLGDSTEAFWIILGIAMSFSLVVLVLFAKKDWI